MQPILKPIVGALTGAALIAAPLAAVAQTHTHSGGFHGGSSFHGGSFHGSASGFHGGFRGSPGFRGYHRNYGGYALGGFGLGLALGAASAPWGYGGYYGPDDYYDYPDTAYAAPPSAACGNWAWNAGTGRYDWIPCQ